VVFNLFAVVYADFTISHSKCVCACVRERGRLGETLLAARGEVLQFLAPG